VLQQKDRVSASRRPLALLALLAAAALGAGCSEDLETGAACPALCPDQNVRIVDTTLVAAVTLDSTVAGYPALGTEPYLLVASRGDTLETRAVIRFDSLPSTYLDAEGDTLPITEVLDSRLRLQLDLTRSKLPTGAITVEAYDVDTTAADTILSAVTALFRPDRLVGSLTIDSADVEDSLFLPLADSAVLDKAVNRGRLRLGLRVSALASVQLRIVSTESGGTSPFPRMSFDPSADTAIHPLIGPPQSDTPADQPAVARDFVDYTIVMASTPVATDALGAGGLPARRSYLRFDIPSAILDSATVVRATLLLTQRPAGGPDVRDTFAVYPHVVIAGVAVTDIARALDFLGPVPGVLSPITGQPDPLALDSIRLAPGDSGTHSVEMVQVLQAWRFRPDTLAPRAIALRSSLEGSTPHEALFFSSDAPPEVRPQLRISYVPRISFGLP
jgi:hypothetical protein